MNKLTIQHSIVLCALCAGCGTFSPDGKGHVLHSRAEQVTTTQTNTDLKSLPEPRGSITAAVYNFKDKTGQYKPSPSNSLSTSVTQGADAILVKAMLDSRWFTLVERSNLQDLLTERKISQSAIVEGESGNTLTPVSPAQVLIQGTIVSYDSNTHTGGSGARLLGLGASQSFREDKVTVNLRLVDIKDGRILHSVSASKKIFSRQLNTGLFSYVDADKILELEAGNSYNEPSHIAIKEAIESALINLIGEGVIRNTWQLADDADINDPVFDRFLTRIEREQYTENAIATAIAIKEQNDFIKKVRKRITRARAGVEYHAYKIEEVKKRKQLAYAQEQAKLRKQNQEALASLERPSSTQRTTETNESMVQASSSSETNRNGVVRKNVQLVDTEATEKLIADQAQAILNAQASIQIQATQQAHQAALYAQQLILQKHAQQQQAVQQLLEESSSQINSPSQNKKLDALQNQQGNVTHPTPTHEELPTRLVQNTVPSAGSERDQAFQEGETR